MVDPNEPLWSAGGAMQRISAPIDVETAGALLKDVPRGALFLASISVGLLFVGWLLFYFLLFLPRGSVG